MNPAFLELQRRTQENLVTFLSIEVDLASTFCEIAESTKDQEHRAKLLENVQKAIRTIRQLEGRIVDGTIRAELDREADRLDEFLDRNPR